MRDTPRAAARLAASAPRAIVALTLLLCHGFDWPGRAERLVNTLTSASTPRDRRDALRLLGELHAREPLPPGLDLSAVEAACQNADPDVRAEAWSLLAAVRHDPERLAPALRDVSPVVRLAAQAALSRLAPEHEALVRAVTDVDPTLRAAAVAQLAGRRDARAVSLLASALRDASIEVRVAAVRALGRRQEPEALGLVVDAADDPLPELRAAALDAFGLAALRTRAAREEASALSSPVLASPARSSARLDTCQRALDDGDQAVVLAALRCLLRAETSTTPAAGHDPRLSALARSLSPIVARAATHLLDRQRPALPQTPAARDPVWVELLEQTASPALSGAQASLLLTQLEAHIPAGETLAADPLLAWLPNAPSSLRVRIARAIQHTHATIPAPLVLALLDDATPTQRAAYVRLLAQTSGAAGDARLLALLDDAGSEVRSAAVFAASRALGAQTLPALLDRLDEVTGQRRLETLSVLAALLDRRQHTAPPLDARLERALVRMLQGELTSRDEASAALALSALGTLQLDAAHALVRAAVVDARPSRSIAALRASTRDGTDAARAARRRMIVHPDPRVSATAMVATALADEPLPLATSLAWLRDAAWPRGPAASFALARAVVRGDPALVGFDPCVWRTRDEPITRHNMAVASVRRSSPACAHDDRGGAPRPRAGPPLATRATDEPAALRLEDSTVIVSIPDASGRIAWPGVAVVEEVSAFLFVGDES